MEQGTILIVEDEDGIRRSLRTTLETHGYRSLEAATGKEALLLVAAQRPDLIILDLGLPDFDGLEVIGRLRQTTWIPIVVLSARNRVADKVTALDAGADDYLTKPFGAGELLARVRAGIRHVPPASPHPAEETYNLGDLQIDRESGRVLVDGRMLHLSPIEAKLLTALLRHGGAVVTNHQLIEEVWGAQTRVSGTSLRLVITQLRRKLEVDPARPRRLLAEPGVGYRLIAP